MRYVISDIHGCYREFLHLLEKIGFSEEDELYILGDMVDRGPEPMKLLQDLMGRANVYPMLGNHDYMALSVLRKFSEEITEENAETHLKEDDLLSWLRWVKGGGDVTSRQFQALDKEEQEDVLDYLEECSLYEEIRVGEKRYILVHAGLNGFTEDKDLEDYDFTDLIFYRTDYKKRYFEDENTWLITGHTPTFKFREDKQNLVYQKMGHIAIDCGCVYGGNLAAFCLETGEVTYVAREE